MKIENNFAASDNYMVSGDVDAGTCFRYVGEETIYFKSIDGCNKLSDGDDNYDHDEEEPVEIVICHFVVDKIIKNTGDYNKYYSKE